MATPRTSPALAGVFSLSLAGLAGFYFIFAAVQGEYGVFRQVQIAAEQDILTAERDRLRADLAVLENRTMRLSDQFLDLDLLDEQARDVLGYVRADEIVIQ